MTEHVHEWMIRENPRSPLPMIVCTHPKCQGRLLIEEAEARINATERLTSALRDMCLITPGNDTICTWCGASWAIGSPQEWHDEDCPLYANILEGS